MKNSISLKDLSFKCQKLTTCKIKIDSSKIEDCKISNLKKLFNSKMKERYNLTVDLINSLNNSIDNKKSIPSSSGAF